MAQKAKAIILFCGGCKRVRKFGRWEQLTAGDNRELALHLGEWETVLTGCPECKRGGYHGEEMEANEAQEIQAMAG